jgi:hypothetical protein
MIVDTIQSYIHWGKQVTYATFGIAPLRMRSSAIRMTKSVQIGTMTMRKGATAVNRCGLPGL